MLGLERNSRLILISQFLVGITYGLFFFILPVHIRSLGASPTQVGITLSAAGLSTLLMVLPFGYLADSYDLRKVMLITKAFPIIPFVLLASANSWQVVMVLLFIIYFEGAVVAVFNSYLTRVLDAKDLQRTFSTIGFGYLLGELIFRSVGARIAEEAGMSLVFYLAAIVFAILASMIVSMLLLVVNPIGVFLVGGVFLSGSVHASQPIVEALMGRTVAAHTETYPLINLSRELANLWFELISFKLYFPYRLHKGTASVDIMAPRPCQKSPPAQLAYQPTPSNFPQGLPTPDSR